MANRLIPIKELREDVKEELDRVANEMKCTEEDKKTVLKAMSIWLGFRLDENEQEI